MINAEDEILIKLETSCTKEEVVARMLGWMQDPIRKKLVEVTEYGIPEDELPFLHALDDSLEEQLRECRDIAQHEFYKALEENTSYDVLKEKENTVTKCDELIETAGIYLADIDDEMAKGESSVLRIDEETTKKTGITHLTLGSVNKWIFDKYGISVSTLQAPRSLLRNLQEKPTLQQENKSDRENKSTEANVENFYTTFAFLVEAFAATSPKDYQKANGELNISAIAEHLYTRAKKANINRDFIGQGYEAIETRIRKAGRVKILALKHKGGGNIL
jgi:hypothetical protein